MVGRCKYSNWPNNCHRALGYEWQLIQQVSWRDGCNMLGQRHDPNQTFVLSDTCRFADTDGLANDIWCDSSACFELCYSRAFDKLVPRVFWDTCIYVDYQYSFVLVVMDLYT